MIIAAVAIGEITGLVVAIAALAPLVKVISAWHIACSKQSETAKPRATAQSAASEECNKKYRQEILQLWFTFFGSIIFMFAGYFGLVVMVVFPDDQLTAKTVGQAALYSSMFIAGILKK